MTAYKGSRGITLLILNFGTGRRRLVKFAIWRRTQIPIKLDAMGPRGSLDLLKNRNLLHLLGFKPRSVQRLTWSLYRRHTSSLLLLLLLTLKCTASLTSSLQELETNNLRMNYHRRFKTPERTEKKSNFLHIVYFTAVYIRRKHTVRSNLKFCKINTQRKLVSFTNLTANPDCVQIDCQQAARIPNCHFTVKVKEKYSIPTVSSGEDLTKVRHCQIIMVGPQGVVGGIPLISISGSFPSNLRSIALLRSNTGSRPGAPFQCSTLHTIQKNPCEGLETTLPQRIKKADLKQKQYSQRGTILYIGTHIVNQYRTHAVVMVFRSSGTTNTSRGQEFS